ncbi:hypothetical protein ACH4VR_29235 [Streptomyces sp. NPDC020883]|uniref:hypothetical protein n=1 Tax=Streptomyces sp. NPDC020883 TaxID=3365099 RepID=UPI003797840D
MPAYLTPDNEHQATNTHERSEARATEEAAAHEIRALVDSLLAQGEDQHSMVVEAGAGTDRSAHQADELRFDDEEFGSMAGGDKAVADRWAPPTPAELEPELVYSHTRDGAPLGQLIGREVAAIVRNAYEDAADGYFHTRQHDAPRPAQPAGQAAHQREPTLLGERNSDGSWTITTPANTTSTFTPQPEIPARTLPYTTIFATHLGEDTVLSRYAQWRLAATHTPSTDAEQALHAWTKTLTQFAIERYTAGDSSISLEDATSRIPHLGSLAQLAQAAAADASSTQAATLAEQILHDTRVHLERLGRLLEDTTLHTAWQASQPQRTPRTPGSHNVVDMARLYLFTDATTTHVLTGAELHYTALAREQEDARIREHDALQVNVPALTPTTCRWARLEADATPDQLTQIRDLRTAALDIAQRIADDPELRDIAFTSSQSDFAHDARTWLTRQPRQLADLADAEGPATVKAAAIEMILLLAYHRARTSMRPREAGRVLHHVVNQWDIERNNPLRDSAEYRALHRSLDQLATSDIESTGTSDLLRRAFARVKKLADVAPSDDSTRAADVLRSYGWMLAAATGPRPAEIAQSIQARHHEMTQNLSPLPFTQNLWYEHTTAGGGVADMLGADLNRILVTAQQTAQEQQRVVVRNEPGGGLRISGIQTIVATPLAGRFPAQIEPYVDEVLALINAHLYAEQPAGFGDKQTLNAWLTQQLEHASQGLSAAVSTSARTESEFRQAFRVHIYRAMVQAAHNPTAANVKLPLLLRPALPAPSQAPADAAATELYTKAAGKIEAGSLLLAAVCETMSATDPGDEATALVTSGVLDWLVQGAGMPPEEGGLDIRGHALSSLATNTVGTPLSTLFRQIWDAALTDDSSSSRYSWLRMVRREALDTLIHRIGDTDICKDPRRASASKQEQALKSAFRGAHPLEWQTLRSVEDSLLHADRASATPRDLALQCQAALNAAEVYQTFTISSQWAEEFAPSTHHAVDGFRHLLHYLNILSRVPDAWEPLRDEPRLTPWRREEIEKRTGKFARAGDRARALSFDAWSAYQLSSGEILSGDQVTQRLRGLVAAGALVSEDVDGTLVVHAKSDAYPTFLTHLTGEDALVHFAKQPHYQTEPPPKAQQLRFPDRESVTAHARSDSLELAAPQDGGILTESRRHDIDATIAAGDLVIHERILIARAHHSTAWHLYFPGTLYLIPGQHPGGFASLTEATAAAEAVGQITDRDGQPFPWDAPLAGPLSRQWRSHDHRLLGDAVEHQLATTPGSDPHGHYARAARDRVARAAQAQALRQQELSAGYAMEPARRAVYGSEQGRTIDISFRMRATRALADALGAGNEDLHGQWLTIRAKSNRLDLDSDKITEWPVGDDRTPTLVHPIFVHPHSWKADDGREGQLSQSVDLNQALPSAFRSRPDVPSDARKLAQYFYDNYPWPKPPSGIDTRRPAGAPLAKDIYKRARTATLALKKGECQSGNVREDFLRIAQDLQWLADAYDRGPDHPKREIFAEAQAEALSLRETLLHRMRSLRQILVIDEHLLNPDKDITPPPRAVGSRGGTQRFPWECAPGTQVAAAGIDPDTSADLTAEGVLLSAAYHVRTPDAERGTLIELDRDDGVRRVFLPEGRMIEQLPPITPLHLAYPGAAPAPVDHRAQQDTQPPMPVAPAPQDTPQRPHHTKDDKVTPLPPLAPQSLKELRDYYLQRAAHTSHRDMQRAMQQRAADASLEVAAGGLILFGTRRYWRLAPSGAGIILERFDSLSFTSKKEAKAFADHLSSLTGADGRPLPWAATDYHPAFAAWRSDRGEDLWLALARFRVEFDQSRGREIDPHAAYVYQPYQDLGDTRGEPAHGHIWPDQIPDNSWVRLPHSTPGTEGRHVQVSGHTTLPHGGVELTLADGETYRQPRNSALLIAPAREVTDADGRRIGERVESSDLQPGHWIQIEEIYDVFIPENELALAPGQTYHLRGRIKEILTDETSGHLRARMEAVSAFDATQWANHTGRLDNYGKQIDPVWDLTQRTVQVTVDEAQFDAVLDHPLPAATYRDAYRLQQQTAPGIVLMTRATLRAAELVTLADPTHRQYDTAKPLVERLPTLARALKQGLLAGDIAKTLTTLHSIITTADAVMDELDVHFPGIEPLFTAGRSLFGLVLKNRFHALSALLVELRTDLASPSPLATMTENQLFDTLEEWWRGSRREDWTREEERWAPLPDEIANAAHVVVLHDGTQGGRSRVKGLAELDKAAAQVLRKASFRPITGSMGTTWDTDSRPEPSTRRKLAEQALTALTALGRRVQWGSHGASPSPAPQPAATPERGTGLSVEASGTSQPGKHESPASAQATPAKANEARTASLKKPTVSAGTLIEEHSASPGHRASLNLPRWIDAPPDLAMPHDAVPVADHPGYLQHTDPTTGTIFVFTAGRVIGRCELSTDSKKPRYYNYLGDDQLFNAKDASDAPSRVAATHASLTGPIAERPDGPETVWIEHHEEATRIHGSLKEDRESYHALQVSGTFRPRYQRIAGTKSFLYWEMSSTNHPLDKRTEAVQRLVGLLASRGRPLSVRDTSEAPEGLPPAAAPRPRHGAEPAQPVDTSQWPQGAQPLPDAPGFWLLPEPNPEHDPQADPHDQPRHIHIGHDATIIARASNPSREGQKWPLTIGEDTLPGGTTPQQTGHIAVRHWQLLHASAGTTPARDALWIEHTQSTTTVHGFAEGDEQAWAALRLAGFSHLKKTDTIGLQEMRPDTRSDKVSKLVSVLARVGRIVEVHPSAEAQRLADPEPESKQPSHDNDREPPASVGMQADTAESREPSDHNPTHDNATPPSETDRAHAAATGPKGPEESEESPTQRRVKAARTKAEQARSAAEAAREQAPKDAQRAYENSRGTLLRGSRPNNGSGKIKGQRYDAGLRRAAQAYQQADEAERQAKAAERELRLALEAAEDEAARSRRSREWERTDFLPGDHVHFTDKRGHRDSGVVAKANRKLLKLVDDRTVPYDRVRSRNRAGLLAEDPDDRLGQRLYTPGPAGAESQFLSLEAAAGAMDDLRGLVNRAAQHTPDIRTGPPHDLQPLSEKMRELQDQAHHVLRAEGVGGSDRPQALRDLGAVAREIAQQAGRDGLTDAPQPWKNLADAADVAATRLDAGFPRRKTKAGTGDAGWRDLPVTNRKLKELTDDRLDAVIARIKEWLNAPPSLNVSPSNLYLRQLVRAYLRDAEQERIARKPTEQHDSPANTAHPQRLNAQQDDTTQPRRTAVDQQPDPGRSTAPAAAATATAPGAETTPQPEGESLGIHSPPPLEPHPTTDGSQPDTPTTRTHRSPRPSSQNQPPVQEPTPVTHSRPDDSDKATAATSKSADPPPSQENESNHTQRRQPSSKKPSPTTHVGARENFKFILLPDTLAQNPGVSGVVFGAFGGTEVCVGRANDEAEAAEIVSAYRGKHEKRHAEEPRVIRLGVDLSSEEQAWLHEKHREASALIGYTFHDLTLHGRTSNDAGEAASRFTAELARLLDAPQPSPGPRILGHLGYDAIYFAVHDHPGLGIRVVDLGFDDQSRPIARVTHEVLKMRSAVELLSALVGQASAALPATTAHPVALRLAAQQAMAQQQSRLARSSATSRRATAGTEVATHGHTYTPMAGAPSAGIVPR